MSKFRKLLAQLRQPSSMAGIAGLAILAGRSLPEAQAVADAIATAAGVLAVVLPEGRGAK